MSTWVIDKQFSFCYGHRVWSQKLENSFCETGDTCAKCRHVHGHEGLVHVFLEGERLSNGMVTDFKHLGWLKNFLDDTIDHKFIIDSHDPLFDKLVTEIFNKTEQRTIGYSRPVTTMKGLPMEPVYVPGTSVITGYTIYADNIVDGPTKEYIEGVYVVDFIPTSENLSKWTFDLVSAKMNQLGIKVSRIDWFETPKSRSSYYAE